MQAKYEPIKRYTERNVCGLIKKFACYADSIHIYQFLTFCYLFNEFMYFACEFL